MSSGLRWAIIGTGRISHSIVADLALLQEHIVVVHSRDGENARAFAERYALSSFTDSLAGLLGRSDVDIVYVATPYTTHYSVVSAALRHDKHVLVEKPIATSAAQTAELFALAHERGRFLMEAMWMKFNPAFQRLLHEVRSGRIGDPRTIRAGFGMPLVPDEGSRWHLDGSPGALLDQGIYPVALAHAVLGEPDEIIARGVTKDGIDLDQQFMLRYQNGSSALGASSIIAFADPSAAVGGTTGWITLPPLFWTTTSLEIHADSWHRMVAEPERVDLPREGYGYVPMLREVADAVVDGSLSHPTHDADQTIAVFRTLDAISAQLERKA